MSYVVKEIFYTLQGEGRNAGRPAVFCRFSGCNLWTGREVDRAKAICQFCDTDFVGVGSDGGRFESPDALADAVLARWPGVRYGRADGGRPLVVCTGGEPLLQLDVAAIDALHARGFQVAVETNGTRHAPAGIDHLCVSPKAGAEWVQRHGSELKVVWPQAGLDLDMLEQADFTYRYLQPMDGPLQARHIAQCIEQCLARPAWRLSLQTHKVTGIR